MKVTKYPQSCLVVDNDGARLLIDPGTIALGSHPLDELGAVDAVLYTHRHADHCDPRAVDALRERGVPLYGNADVRALLGEDVHEVADGERFEVAGFEVLARDLPHVVMVNGDPGPPNTGFLVDGRLFHPGDGLEVDGLRVEAVAVPIAGPSISARDAYRFVERVGASTAIPIHYDFFPENPELFAAACDLARVVVLAPGESVTL